MCGTRNQIQQAHSFNPCTSKRLTCRSFLPSEDDEDDAYDDGGGCEDIVYARARGVSSTGRFNNSSSPHGDSFRAWRSRLVLCESFLVSIPFINNIAAMRILHEFGAFGNNNYRNNSSSSGGNSGTQCMDGRRDAAAADDLMMQSELVNPLHRFLTSPLEEKHSRLGQHLRGSTIEGVHAMLSAYHRIVSPHRVVGGGPYESSEQQKQQDVRQSFGGSYLEQQQQKQQQQQQQLDAYYQSSSEQHQYHYQHQMNQTHQQMALQVFQPTPQRHQLQMQSSIQQTPAQQRQQMTSIGAGNAQPAPLQQPPHHLSVQQHQQYASSGHSSVLPTPLRYQQQQ